MIASEVRRGDLIFPRSNLRLKICNDEGSMHDLQVERRSPIFVGDAFVAGDLICVSALVLGEVIVYRQEIKNFERIFEFASRASDAVA